MDTMKLSTKLKYHYSCDESNYIQKKNPRRISLIALKSNRNPATYVYILHSTSKSHSSVLGKF